MTTLLHAAASFQPTPVLAEFAPGPWIVIIMPLAGLAFAALGLIGGLIQADRTRRMRHETIRLALEKGQPIPPELVQETKPLANAKRAPRNDRRSGIVLLGLAAGLYVALAGLGAGGAKWLAAFPGFLGLALLINWLIEGRPQNPPAPPVA